jgi:hypothetical protein
MYVGVLDLILALMLWAGCLLVKARLQDERLGKYLKWGYWWRTERIRMEVRPPSVKGEAKGQAGGAFHDSRRGSAEGFEDGLSFVVLYFWILLLEALLLSTHLTKPYESYLHRSPSEVQGGFTTWALLMTPVILLDKIRRRFSLYAGLLIWCLVIAKVPV